MVKGLRGDVAGLRKGTYLLRCLTWGPLAAAASICHQSYKHYRPPRNIVSAHATLKLLFNVIRGLPYLRLSFPNALSSRAKRTKTIKYYQHDVGRRSTVSGCREFSLQAGQHRGLLPKPCFLS